MHRCLVSVLRLGLLTVILVGLLFQTTTTVYAAASLTIIPLTWNVTGLDSNNVNVGPNNFPVGVRVCNVGDATATNVGSTFVWDSANANINLRAGSNTSYSGYTLAAGACVDFYYEVTITRTSTAYNTARRYHITASATGLTPISTTIPREIFVEHLVSQNRNSVTDVQLDGVSVAAGGTLSLLVGNTYNIKLVGNTATNGYEQVESFINFPNTIFQVNSVTTTYSANAGTDPLAPGKPYADGCGWTNDPTSPNYRSCTGTGKYGGNITVTYNVTIIGGGGTSQVLNTLIYDFSGSSYHYNSDFSTSSRIASIIDPSSLTFSKAFSPSSTSAGGVSTLTFTITNPASSTFTGVNFTDVLPTSPGAMRVASPATYSTSGCGTPTFAPAANDATLTFSNGTLAPNGTCTISVVVSVPASPTTGTYSNTSNHLFVNSLDTGKFATASLTLTAASSGTGLCGLTLAQWVVPSGSTNPPDTSGGSPTTQASNVTTATASTTTTGAYIDTNIGNPAPSWAGHGFSGNVTVTGDSSPYFQFVIDTSNYIAVKISLDYRRDSNWGGGSAGTPTVYVWSSTTGGAGSFSQIFSSTTFDSTFRSTGAQTATTTGSSLTYFRVNAKGATNGNADMEIDNITITGCSTAQKPTMTKAFSLDPIAVNATSTLTFTLTNPNSVQLTGVAFTDVLPSGLEVAAPPSASTTCGGPPTWSPAAGATTLTFSGATIPASGAGGSCTVSVAIRATSSGPHANVSGFISSTETGTNTGSGGSATATLTALQPPSLSKLFATNPILAGGTSALVFTITNPNPNNVLSNISFTDTFPAGLTTANPPAASQCNGSVASTSGSIALSGGSISAGGSCTVTINVTAATAGTYVNTSGNVSAVISNVTSTGNTGTDTLTVNPPHPSISLLKQISTSASGPWFPFVTVTPGANIYYRFTIENTGDVALSPVSVTDAIVNTASCSWPSSLPVASALNDNHIASCIVGPLTALSGDNPNTATASGTYSGTRYSSSPSSADYLGASAGFSLIKQVSTSANGPWSTAISGVAPSSNVYYKFTVVNTGGLPLSGINVTDIVPSVNILAASCIFSDPLAVGNATTCTVGPVSAPASAGTNSNTATAHGTNSGTTFDTAPSSASYTVTTNPPDLIVTKSDSTAGNALLNTAFTWTLTISNQGAGDATFADGQFILSDPLPANATYGSPTTGNFTNITNSANIGCSIVSGTLSCVASGAMVVVGSGGSFDVSVDATPIATGSLSNTVAVDPRGNIAETNETNNNGSDTVTVVSTSPDLSLVKTDGSITYTPGAPITYTITVTNAATVTSTGTVADSFPAFLTNISWTCSGTGGATCSASGTGNINDPVSIPVGQSVTYTINANVLSNATGNLDNTAAASLSSGTDPTPGNNSSTDTDTPNIVSDLEVTKTDVVTNISTGATTTYTIVVTNHGPSDADNSLFTDPAVAGLNATSVTCGSPSGGAVCPSLGNTTVALMQGAGIVLPTLPSGGSVTFTVDATVAAMTGSVANTANVAPPAGVNDPGTFPNSATDTDNVIAIIAADDAGSAVNGTTGGQSLANVLTNDTLNGSPATLATVTLTQVSTTNPGVTLDVTTGAVNVAPGTPAGNYVVTYQICDQSTPPICDTANVNVPVVVINAVNDAGSTIIGAVGGQSLADVLTNDTLNGNSATLANVNLTQISTTNPGVTLDLTTRAVNVAPGTPAGNYTITYQICAQTNPTICDTANVSVPVSAAPIVAVDDSASGVNSVTGATAVLNVFNNDTLNGAPLVPSDVTLTETVPDPSGALTLNPDGTVDVAAGTAAGTYQLTYQICEVLNPTNCATAVVRVTVIAPGPPLARDDSATTPFNTPVTLSNITANDSASGLGNSILINTIDLDPAASGQQTSFTDSSGNQWSVNTTTGEVTFSPAANFTGIATIPYSVQDAIGQSVTANLSVTVGPPASISGTVFNDANLNGTQGAGEAGLVSVKVDLYNSAGTTLIATITTTAGGSYSFSNLTPGDYLVLETDLTGYVSTTPNSVPATVSAGGSATVNFGDYQLPSSIPSGIVGMVFNDANGNGIQDSGEAALSGVKIELKNNAGTVIATTTTDALGSYGFPNLPAGMFMVTETDPTGFVSTTLNTVGVNLSAGTIATINFGDQTSGTAQIADPAVTKFGSPTTASVGSAVIYTLTVGNTGNTNAANVVLTDTKPAFLNLISITISPNPGLTPVISGNTFTINFGTVTPTDSFIVTVVTRVNSLGQPPGGSNNVSLVTSSPTDRSPNNAFSASLQITSSSGGGGVRNVRKLPETGFAPGVVTDLSHVPHEVYVNMGDVMLEIPSLGVKIPVVGVPLKEGGWNVSWLMDQAGWLGGTAFPSWNGNSVLTSHVYLSNGLAGPFVNLHKLKFGDTIIIHAYGSKYTFEVQANTIVEPNDISAFKHEEKPWLTLITCKEYDEKLKAYRQRVVVKAVLVKVAAE